VLNAAEKAQDLARAQTDNAATEAAMTSLAGYIRGQFEIFKRHRNNSMSGWSERLLIAMRAFNGQYDPTKLADIRRFGGSEVYAKIIAMKCRGATSLLRDVYLGSDRAWGVEAPPDPEVPPEIHAKIQQLITAESMSAQQAGQPPDPGAIRDRVNDLVEAARQAAKKKADKQAAIAEDKVDELLIEGAFYQAMAEFLVDLPLFPFACIKGPTVRIVPDVVWNQGSPLVQQKPRLFWNRVSPFDIWWTPGVNSIEDASIIERTRVTRAELNDLLDLPGYNQQELRAVLDEYGRGGLADNWDYTDSERAVLESRENPLYNQSGLINCLEWNGNVQGRMLLEYGMPSQQIPDELRDYMVQAWLIGSHVIKAQMSPSPRKRPPYYITSFEKVPGTPVGNGLPDVLSDIQEVCNATLRALVNNLSMASGPQVVVNDDRSSPGTDNEELYPWKRWHVTSDPMANNTQPPISFFQPNANSGEMLAVYNAFTAMADDLSAIPRYLAGQSAGGAGRTASGLSMLMSNASKILQTVAANIDGDVLEPALQNLFDMILLTDESGLLTGEEDIRVRGVTVAVQRETQRSRQLEFLQITNNPTDMAILGLSGRAKVLRPVAQGVGIDGDDIVPSDDQLDQKQQQMQMAAMAAQAQGNQPPKPTNQQGPHANTVPTRIAGGVG
jgi:hypothetical protein